MKSTPYVYAEYTPAEFEQFRTAVQNDGFVLTQNTIDTVSGHIGALIYLTGDYNRAQRQLTVTVKTSPWQNFTDADVKTNLDRIVQRSETAEAPVNQVTMSTPPTSSGTGVTMPPKAAVTTAAAPAPTKAPETPVPTQKPVPTQTPIPAQTPASTTSPKPDGEAPKSEEKPSGEAATASPTEKK